MLLQHCVMSSLLQARVAALRSQLGAVEAEKAAEVETRMKSVQELSLALQVAVTARCLCPAVQSCPALPCHCWDACLL